MARPQRILPTLVHGVWRHEQRGVDYLYWVRLNAIGGRVAAADVRLSPAGYHAVTHEALNRFPLAAIIDAHIDRVDFDKLLRAMAEDPDATAAERRSARLMVKARSREGDPTSRARRKRKAIVGTREARIRDELVPLYLELIADRRTKNVTREIAQRLRCADQTVSNDLTYARKLGLLPTTTREKGNR